MSPWGQNDKKHGPASIQARQSCTPSLLPYRKNGTQRPIIGIRVFNGGAQQVINEIVYYIHYGYMRCNISQDVHLQEGVYAYADIISAFNKLDRTSATDRKKCIGIIEGYLKHRHDDKISLNPRSTKLLAVFSPWDEEIHLPFELGAEDAMAFCLPPHQLGGPIRWSRQLWCIDGRYYNKPAIRAKLDSGEWPTPLTDHMLDHCAKVAQYNIASLNADDIIDQKNLWIKMLEEPTAFNPQEFGLGLNHNSLTHKGATPLCMKYLRDFNKKITA